MGLTTLPSVKLSTLTSGPVRNSSTTTWLPEAPNFLSSMSFADDDVEDDRELVALVQKALSQLSEQQRRIVELHVMEGMKYLEIADLLQLSENTVRTHLKRAYKILRENLSCLVLDIFF